MRQVQQVTLLVLTFSAAHKNLVEQFRVLHRDVSDNNVMIYTCDVPEDQTRQGEAPGDGKHRADGGSSHLKPGINDTINNGEETYEQKLARWEQERRQQIRAGALRNGLLIDFDYATEIDQPLHVVAGDRTVSNYLFINLTHTFCLGNNPIYVISNSSQLQGR